MILRKTNPSDDNKYYLRGKNGYSKFGRGNTTHGLNHGVNDVLPNCVSFAAGAFGETQELEKNNHIPVTDAKLFLAQNKYYKEGFTPRVGSIMVYSSKGAGHVVYVVDIDKNGTCLCSMSGWNATKKRVWTQKIKAHKYHYASGYTYLGCIYPEKNLGFHYYGTLPQKNLSYGKKGIDVKRLQDFLNWCLGEYLTVDGSYGPATRDAVKKFQKEYKLVVDGMFGPACRNKAKTITL